MLCPLGVLAQLDDSPFDKGNDNDKREVSFKSLRPKKKKDSITFTANDYKMITYKRDTTAIDTTISMAKYYRSNEWFKDMFGKMPFANMGQPYNTMAYDFTQHTYLPEMGATAKKQLYFTPEEVMYYYLPTPISQFTYKTGMEQGQSLDVLFSANLQPNLNIFIAYRGLRSLGKYQRALVSNGNFRAGFSYISPNKKYTLFAHFANHDIDSNENGGITTPSQFESGVSEFKNRAAIDVQLLDAENSRESKRYFLQHDYAFLRNRDSVASYKQIRFRHLFMYETEKYSFSEAAKNDFLGNAYVSTNISDKARLQTMVNRVGAALELPYLGRTFLFGNAYFYNYYFRNAYYVSGVLQRHQIKNTDFSIGGEWHKKIGGLTITAEGEQTLVGNITGTRLSGKLQYAFSERNRLTAGATLRSQMPNFNYLLYQSDYKAFNWDNYTDFEKENTQTLYADLQTQWGNAYLALSNLNNYTYFRQLTLGQAIPEQHSSNIQYLQLKLQKEFTFGKWGLDNTLMYQQVIQQDDVLNVPAFITRNSFYFKSPLFQNAMILQTGIGVNYFTKYYANSYNPLLAEFAVQNNEKIGNFPTLDFFLNAKVRTMRIFFSLEQWHVPLSSISWMPFSNPYHYYSAPRQPYRDFIVRLGISWNLFN
jgi:hypothetical protein